MGKKLVKQLLPGLEKMQLPENAAGDSARSARRIESDWIRLIRIKAIRRRWLDALGTFRSGQSRPFTCAGIAYTLVAASQEQDGSYDPIGLDAAMEWLEKAQETEPDILLINMIEALIYIYNGRFEDARLVLEYLHQQDADQLLFACGRDGSGATAGEIEKAGLWYEQGRQIGASMRRNDYDCKPGWGIFIWSKAFYDKALVMFKEAAHFDKKITDFGTKLASSSLSTGRV